MEAKQDVSVHEVDEGTTVLLTVSVPMGKVTLLKDSKELPTSEHVKITQTSPTSNEIQIVKAKPDDDGLYVVRINDHEQPLMQLKVVPKPVSHQIMELPQTVFSEGDTLTITCRFDSTPDETFEFLHNGQSLPNDDRISTSVDDNTYTIVVKQLKPGEDEGVYTLKSPHLILDTPTIVVDAKTSLPDAIDVIESTEMMIEVSDVNVENVLDVSYVFNI